MNSSPATAIIGYDLLFYEKMTKLAPHNPNARLSFCTGMTTWVQAA
jgi:hypothetical protein